MDSHNRLFGDVDRPSTPAKNHMRSSIPIGGTDAIDSNGHAKTNGMNGHANGMNGHGNGHSETHEKPMTNGNGHHVHTNGHHETGISKSKYKILDTIFCVYK